MPGMHDPSQAPNAVQAVFEYFNPGEQMHLPFTSTKSVVMQDRHLVFSTEQVLQGLSQVSYVKSGLYIVVVDGKPQ